MKLSSFIYQSALKIYRAMPAKKQIATFLKNSFNNTDKFYSDLRFKGPFELELDNGKSLQLYHHYTTTIENELFWKGFNNWEKVSTDIWQKLAVNSNVIFDIGANTGIYALLAAKENPSAKIFAFEPSINMFKKLKTNIELNQFNNIAPVKKAVSDQNGEATFFEPDTDHHYSASLNPKMKEGRDIKFLENKVTTCKLDFFVEEQNIEKVDLLKVDVEMHEPEVLRGFINNLKKNEPPILMEILTDEIAKQIESILRDTSYKFYAIDENSNTLKKTNHVEVSKGNNVLICTDHSFKPLQSSYQIVE